MPEKFTNKNLNISALKCLAHVSIYVFIKEILHVHRKMVSDCSLFHATFYFQPAHIKAMFIGSSVTIPITDGRLNTGTWQGLWLCEHRNHASKVYI